MVELSLDQVNKVVSTSLKDTMKDMQDFLDANVYHHTHGDTSFVPLYSYDYETEKRKVTKMMKALKRVNGWYSNEDNKS